MGLQDLKVVKDHCDHAWVIDADVDSRFSKGLPEEPAFPIQLPRTECLSSPGSLRRVEVLVGSKGVEKVLECVGVGEKAPKERMVDSNVVVDGVDNQVSLACDFSDVGPSSEIFSDVDP